MITVSTSLTQKYQDIADLNGHLFQDIADPVLEFNDLIALLHSTLKEAIRWNKTFEKQLLNDTWKEKTQSQFIATWSVPKNGFLNGYDAINPETPIGTRANPGFLTGNQMQSVKLKNSASSQSDTSWSLKNSLKSELQPSNGSCANLDTRYHLIALFIAF